MKNLSFSTDMRNKMQTDELKRQLLECVKSEKAAFTQLADEFYKNDYRDREHHIAVCKEIVTTIDRILEAGDWNDSLFLRNTAKPLRAIRDETAELLANATGESQEGGLERHQLAEGMVTVFISIYQSDGHNIPQWETQLRSISRYLVGRPVYEKEEDVQKVIRMKLAKTSEAYIVAAVKKTAISRDIFQPEKFDRNGNKLLTLTAGAVEPSNILQFVHQGKRYRFIEGRLIEQ